METIYQIVVETLLCDADINSNKIREEYIFVTREKAIAWFKQELWHYSNPGSVKAYITPLHLDPETGEFEPTYEEEHIWLGQNFETELEGNIEALRHRLGYLQAIADQLKNNPVI